VNIKRKCAKFVVIIFAMFLLHIVVNAEEIFTVKK
jgi:hypothetical protein